MYSPYSTSQYSNSPMMSPQINTTTTNNTSSSPSSSLNSPSSSSYSKYNRSGSKPINNRLNNFQKRNFHQKLLLNNSNNNVPVSTTATTTTTMNGGVPTSNIIFSPLESIYLNNPILATQPPGTFDDYLNDEQTHKLIDPNVTVYSPPPPQIYCDINGNLIGLPDNLDNCCGNSFGDETNDYYENNPNDYDYDDNNNNNNDSSHVSNDNDEMLACTICRGRRMCFCYFLKVRYYKFPSFFDLVDHQYKKWRASLAKAKKAT